ncbi:heme-binding protein [Burkholderia sp. Cy-637]|uniref:GlcG/HbpS family heme-binding protein n=1 Tax=Burkholderia sp. Cy-637 TaxID=2608327 RepID=UPI0014225CAC|nr:heme-binding protein [Burkholderia sp. Cy-637]NIF92643.1 heme-binding protein [Burkholderia sp. Cy-637]
MPFLTRGAKRAILVALLPGAALSPALAAAQSLAVEPALTLALAREAADTALAAAQARGNAVVVSIVDAGGHPLYLERADAAPAGMVDASLAKARTASAYGFPSAALEAAIRQGRSAFLDLPGALPLEGGLPVLANGRVIGAIGVAGGQPEDDGAAARAGLARLVPPDAKSSGMP